MMRAILQLCFFPPVARRSVMTSTRAELLRRAIENLINVKLHDVLAHPGGLDRLRANRATGVASPPVRRAEQELEAVLFDVLELHESQEVAA